MENPLNSLSRGKHYEPVWGILKTKGVAELNAEIAQGGVETIVSIEILDIMVQDNKRLTTRLRYPMQAAVDSDRLRIVVVLNQIRPRELVGKEDVEPDPREPQREVPFEDLNIIMAVGHKAPEIPTRIPGHLRIDIVSIPAEKLSTPVGQCRR